jgi:drug/metabolite transporter (DMT)-like permease
MNLLIKLITNDTTESMAVFFRSVISSIWVTVVFIYKRLNGKCFPIKTKHFGLQLLRAVTSFAALLALYHTIKYAPLVDANALYMSYTLFIPFLGAVFFGTKTNIKNWLAIVVGFIGILFILKPYSSNFNPVTLIALISSLATATSFLVLYELAKHDKPHTILLYYFYLMALLSGVSVILNWQLPSIKSMAYLLLIGAIGTAYHEFLTRSMLYAPPKVVGPLLYSSILFSGIFDWIFWKHIPDMCFWIGAILVILGCVFSIRYTSD